MRIKFTTSIVVLVTAALFLAGSWAMAEGKLQVGERFPITIEPGGLSDLRSTAADGGEQVWKLHHPDATYISLHFSRLELAPGERLLISDPAGGQSYTLTGRGKMGAAAFWAQHVKGDTLILTLSAGAAGTFMVDEYAAGFVDLGGGPEAICGLDDKQNAVCYSATHPVEYDTSRAVARLLINGGFLCTGWLVSPDNHFITNEHCVTSATEALNTDFEFMAEAPTCGSSNCQLCYPGDLYSGASFIQDNAALDYALLRFTSGDPAATYGYMEIDNRAAVVGEEIYIPQHPSGYAKELGIESTDSTDSGGVCTVFSVTSPPCSGSGYNDVGYYCDTEGGSSGSPVLARSSHKVIALHHCADCPNRGVPITLVYDEIQSYLGSCGDGSCGSGEDSCSCPADCGLPQLSETSCTDGVDNDCDTFTDCDDADCSGSPSCICDGDGTCEAGEDCTNCGDCIGGGGGAVCGNGICETADDEDCRSCPADCNGKTNGALKRQFCCGVDVACSDSRCSTDGWLCTSTPAEPFCCGDGICEGIEEPDNCGIDCAGAFCGDGNCDSGEDQCTCAADCGFPPTEEMSCSDGIDDDCDGSIDCADADCDGDPACECGVPGDPCAVGADCCSGSCHPRRLTCR